MYLISCLICILNAEKQSQETGAVGWADQPPTLRASERSGETGLAHKGHIAGAGGGVTGQSAGLQHLKRLQGNSVAGHLVPGVGCLWSTVQPAARTPDLHGPVTGRRERK